MQTRIIMFAVAVEAHRALPTVVPFDGRIFFSNRNTAITSLE